MLAEVATDIPAVRISAGWISAGTSHPRGPAQSKAISSKDNHLCWKSAELHNMLGTLGRFTNFDTMKLAEASFSALGLMWEKLTPRPGKVGDI